MSTALKQLICLRCGYEWWPKSLEKPKTCANKKCNSPYWDRPRRSEAVTEVEQQEALKDWRANRTPLPKPKDRPKG